MSEIAKGERVRCFPGAREGRHYLAEVISDGVVEFGGTPCYRVRKDDGGTDYIAVTHVVALTDYQLGQRVRFTTHLKRRHRRVHEKDRPMKIWSTESWPGHTLDGGEGIIIGKRKLADGDREWYDEAGYIFLPKEYLDAYLVAFDLRRKPVHVLPEHLTPLEDR